jgi:hypothetical protein
VASSGDRISLRVILEEEEVEGNLTTGGTGWHRDCGGLAMMRRGGGARSLSGRRLGHGGRELGTTSGARRVRQGHLL